MWVIRYFQISKSTIRGKPFKTKLTSLVNTQGLTDRASLKIVVIVALTVGALTDAILFSFLSFFFFFFFWGGGGAVYKHMAVYDGYCPEVAVRFAFILTERATCYFGYRMVFALFCMDSSLIILRNMLKCEENIKAPRRWPLRRESTGDRWILLKKGQ